MRFEQQLTLDPGDLHRLVDQPHRGSDRHQRKQRSDVFGIHADAPVRHRHTHRRRVVGAVKHVLAVARGEAQGEITEWIVGARPHDLRQRIAILGVLLADRLRRIPGRVSDLGDDPRVTERCTPVHLADAHRVGDDDRLLALAGLGVVVQPVLGQVHDQARTRARRQDAPPGQHQPGARPRQPHIDAGVRANDFVIAETVAVRDIRQRVFVHRLHALVAPHHRRAVRRQGVDTGPARGRQQANPRERPQKGSRFARLIHVISVNNI